MSAYRKFSDVLRGELVASAPPKAPKVPKAEPCEPEAQTLGGLDGLGSVLAEIEKRPASADPHFWRDLFEKRVSVRQFGGKRSRAEAERLAWAELQGRWHHQHGDRVHCDICAGCRRPIVGAKALDMIDGNRVHFGDGDDCLIRHGERWRRAATRALVGMDLQPPPGEDTA